MSRHVCEWFGARIVSENENHESMEGLAYPCIVL